MKKAIVILVLGLLLSGNAFAELFSFSNKMWKLSQADSPSVI